MPPSGSWLPLSSLQYGEGKGATMESQRYTYKMPLQSPVLIRSRNVLLVRIAHILLKTDASSPALRRMPGLGPEQRSPSLFPCQVLSREPYQSWRILCALFPRPGEKKNGHIYILFRRRDVTARHQAGVCWHPPLTHTHAHRATAREHPSSHGLAPPLPFIENTPVL